MVTVGSHRTLALLILAFHTADVLGATIVFFYLCNGDLVATRALFLDIIHITQKNPEEESFSSSLYRVRGVKHHGWVVCHGCLGC